jgi:hypothetical protein
MIQLQYTHIASQNFISNCLHQIILVNIFDVLQTSNFNRNIVHLLVIINKFKFYVLGILYLLHCMCILNRKGGDLKPEIQL